MNRAKATARPGNASENAACKAMLVAAEPKINALIDEIIAGGVDVAVLVTDPFYPVEHEETMSPAELADLRAMVDDNGGVPLVKVLPIELISELFAEKQNAVSDSIIQAIQRDRDPGKIPIVFAFGSMFGVLAVDMPARLPAMNAAGGDC